MKSESVKILQKKKKQLLEKWMQNQLSDEGLRDDLMTNDELRNQSQELVTLFVDCVSEKGFQADVNYDFEKVIDILAGISVSRAHQGFSPREIGSFVSSFKNAILEILAQEISDYKELYEQSIQLGKIFDVLSLITFENFIKKREEVILRQTEEIAEISTPVIRVWNGIVALPIIGTLDSSRTQIVMENLLQEIVDTGSSIAILDISGVPAVDSLVAQHLIKTVSATRLMGAECIISGIRPEIAQTVVHLGIDLSNIITKSTLASALHTAFKMLKLEVSRESK